ncbi:unnamed protein product [Periconia digitata]|uniref:Uncharacterized protein n=1 Tax=Periconia digitata TaxID=1303443 RepID=A0A9W4XE61_9PLEO|nr:unnamed protein product [Periconia digitata]
MERESLSARLQSHLFSGIRTRQKKKSREKSKSAKKSKESNTMIYRNGPMPKVSPTPSSSASLSQSVYCEGYGGPPTPTVLPSFPPITL